MAAVSPLSSETDLVPTEIRSSSEVKKEEINTTLAQKANSSDSDIEIISVTRDIPIIDISDDSSDDIKVNDLMELINIFDYPYECYEEKVDDLLKVCRLKAEIDKARQNGAMNEMGPFYINRRVVPVNIYQEGLIINVWSPIQVLKEISQLCRWSTPTYKALHFIPTGGFRCSVYVNGVEFVPKLLGRSPNLAKDVAAANFLHFLGFKLNIENLYLHNDWQHIDKAKVDVHMNRLGNNVLTKSKIFQLNDSSNKMWINTKKARKTVQGSIIAHKPDNSIKNMNILYYILSHRRTYLNDINSLQVSRDRLNTFDEIALQGSFTNDTDCAAAPQLHNHNTTSSSLKMSFKSEMMFFSTSKKSSFRWLINNHKGQAGKNQSKKISKKQIPYTTKQISHSINTSKYFDLRQKLANKLNNEHESDKSYSTESNNLLLTEPCSKNVVSGQSQSKSTKEKNNLMYLNPKSKMRWRDKRHYLNCLMQAIPIDMKYVNAESPDNTKTLKLLKMESKNELLCCHGSKISNQKSRNSFKSQVSTDQCKREEKIEETVNKRTCISQNQIFNSTKPLELNDLRRKLDGEIVNQLIGNESLSLLNYEKLQNNQTSLNISLENQYQSSCSPEDETSTDFSPVRKRSRRIDRNYIKSSINKNNNGKNMIDTAQHFRNRDTLDFDSQGACKREHSIKKWELLSSDQTCYSGSETSFGHIRNPISGNKST
uniref:DRBM domain-containing protein n=1 Tax=Graphocephala atropunctata TaxID=36148 RepID=A0A1B6M793_9HEMI